MPPLVTTLRQDINVHIILIIIVVSSFGRTEYQLLLKKTSVRDRNVEVNNIAGGVLTNCGH